MQLHNFYSLLRLSQKKAFTHDWLEFNLQFSESCNDTGVLRLWRFPGLPQSEKSLSLNNNPVSVIELEAKSRELEAMLQTKFCYSLKETNHGGMKSI